MSAVLNITVQNCEHCQGSRRVWNQWAGKKIRCVECTKAPRDRKAMQALTERNRAAEREQHAIDTEPVKLVTGLAWTVDRLYQWGKFVRDYGIGYPPMSTTEKARIGRGGQSIDSPLPLDLQAIDFAVSVAPIEFKTILVEHYTKNGYTNAKAAHLGISRQTYYQRKASAERHIATAIGV